MRTSAKHLPDFKSYLPTISFLFSRRLAVSSRTKSQEMPPVRSARNRKPPPDGFDDIEDTLFEFANKMKDAENGSQEGKKRHEVLWPIFQISHQRMSLPSVIDIVTYSFYELQAQNISTTYTTTKKPYRSSFTNGY